MMRDAGQPLDDLSDSGQGPQIGAEPLRVRPGAQRPRHAGQLRGRQSRLPAGSPGRLEPLAALGLPHLMPMIHRGGGDPQGPRHRSLQLASREQLRSVEPPSFQRSKIPSGPPAGGWHVSA